MTRIIRNDETVTVIVENNGERFEITISIYKITVKSSDGHQIGDFNI
jgi:hypothetical protein